MTTPATPLCQEGDFYVPAFEIKINGMDLTTDVSHEVMEIRYQDSLDQIDHFEITVNNWDAAQRDFRFTGSGKAGTEALDRSDLFDPGQELELWLGYRTGVKGQPALRLMLAGFITSLVPTFPASGPPTLKVSGQNVLRQLLSRQETHNYPPNLKASDIAKLVEQRGKLKIGNLKIPINTDRAPKDQEPPLGYVIQNNQFDIVFLLQLAHQHGYELCLRYEDERNRLRPYLHFGPLHRQRQTGYLLEWGKSLISFQPRLTIARQVQELTVRGWDSQQKKAIKVTVKRQELATVSLADRRKNRRIEASFQERAEVVVDRPFRNATEAKEHARARLADLARGLVTAKGLTLGAPDLRAGTKLQIEGLGPTFSGPYLVTATTHSLTAAGYLTEFEARLEEQR